MGRIIVGLVGIIYVVIGILGLAATKKTTSALINMVKNTKHQNLGLFSLVFGALLLISAPQVREVWFVLMLGTLACLKGTTIILMSRQKINAVMDWWLSAPDIVHKGWASFALILGVVIFFII